MPVGADESLEESGDHPLSLDESIPPLPPPLPSLDVMVEILRASSNPHSKELSRSHLSSIGPGLPQPSKKARLNNDSPDSDSPTHQAPLAPCSTHQEPLLPHNTTTNQVTCKCRKWCNAVKSCPCKKASQYCSIECHPRYSCTNCRTKDSSGPIDLSKKASPAPSAMSWVVIGGVTLYEEHRLILSSPEWLDDDIIRASQNLLKEQFPLVGGLQAPALAEKNAMEPQSGEFVQILCVGQNHWITVSTIGCPQGLVRVYDSLHGNFHQPPSA